MKKSFVRVLLAICLMMPFAAFAVPAQAAIGGQLYGTGGDITVQVMPAAAGYNSELWLYSPVQQFIGLNTEVGKVVTITGIPAGQELVFGIYVRNTGHTFKMGPGSRNPDGLPHANVVQVAERVFDTGFEDLYGGGDQDYDDNVFRFSGALAPVPPPVDSVAPVSVHAFMPAPNSHGWINQPVTVSLTATDTAQAGVTASGVQQLFAAVDGTLENCPAGAACSFTVAGSGLKTVSYHARDNAGNVEAVHQFQLNLDPTAPVIAGTVDRPANAFGWYDAPVTVSFSCSDSLSGIQFCAGPVTLGEGAGQSVTGSAADMAGNTASATVQHINVDMGAPSISFVAAPAAVGGWNNTPVSIQFICSDALSGIDSCPADVTLTEAGSSVTVSATDKAGNSAAITVSLQIDQTMPAITGAPDRSANAYGWYNAPVVVSFTCSDSQSGIFTCSGPTTLYEGAGQSATGAAVDVAGNMATASVDGINIDMTAPMITGGPDRAANINGWYNTDVTVSFACRDAGSGIAACSGPATLGEGAGQSVTGTAADMADNSASVTVSGINIDKTAPVVSFSGNAGSYAVDELVSISCAAADALSGVAASDCAGISGAAWTFGPGTHSFSASATDNAGNTGSASTSFAVAVTEESLCRLVQQWSSKAGVANSLCAKLRNAAKAETPQARAGLLSAFVHEVEAQSGKAFTEANALTLVYLAHKL